MVPPKGYRLATAVTPEAAPPMAGRAGTVPAEISEQRLAPHFVAVLQFVMRGLPEPLSFLSDNLTGALISELSRQPGLAVVALGTMLTFGQRHPPPQKLADDLGVRYLVDGQFEQRGDMPHVGVQVVDARRGTQTWADALTLPANAWHATASAVVGRLARALRFEHNDLASQEALVPASDAEMPARAFAAQAWVHLFARAQTQGTNQRATRLARSAVTPGARAAPGLDVLGLCRLARRPLPCCDEPRDEQLARALAEAERAGH